MKRLSNTSRYLFSLLMVGMLLAGCMPLPETIGLSPLNTPLPVARSPLATPTCNPPWPTPPALVCPWLPTPTSQPTSSFPTMTPWIPPTALPRAPTPLPLPQPAKNAAGRLFYRTSTRLSDGSLVSILHASQVDTQGLVSQPPLRIYFQPPTGMALPAGYDFSMSFNRLVPSPNGRYLAGIRETETGEAISVIDVFTSKPTMPGDGWLNWIGSNGNPQSANGFFYGWHPNGYEFLFREENAPDRGLWLVDARNGQHRLIAQLPTLDISGAAISPDGQRLAYATNTFDVHQIWVANADGSKPRLFLESNTIVYVFSWSPNGRYLLYTGEPTPVVGKGTPSPNTGGPLWVMDSDGENRRSLRMPFILGFGFKPVWSPTGRHVAGVGGTDEVAPCWQKGDVFQADPLCWFKGTGVYIEDIDTSDLQLVARNALDPIWSPDGSLVAMSRMDEKQQVDIWLSDTQGHNLRRLIDTLDVDRYPIWLPR